MAQHGFGSRHAVGRQLHDEGQALALDEEAAEELGHQHGHNHAQQVESHEHEGRPLAEEGRDEYHIDGDARRAAHHGDDEHGEQARLAVLNGACGHDGRHVAA